MHELSIATRLVEMVGEQLAASGGRAGRITLRIGRLSCVHEDSLRFSFDLVREGTPAAEATLEIVQLPVRVYCQRCDDEFELPGIQRFICPSCGRPSGDIRQGRELDLESIEVLETT